MMNLGGIAGLRQSQESKIPEGMASLIQSLKDLKRTANPVTPAGTPTVAGQVEQAIAQRLTPQADISQPGTPQMQPVGPGIQQSAQMANIAAQQQQAQQQQAMQAAMQMAQQQPQPMAEGGIALLPADNMARIQQYARGGVLGFDGQDRSDVPNPDRESLLDALKAIRDQGLLPAGAAIADIATMLPRSLLGAYNKTVVRGLKAAGVPAADLPDVYGGDYSSATPFYDKLIRGQGVEQPFTATADKTPQELQAETEKYKPTSLAELIQQGAAATGGGDPYAQALRLTQATPKKGGQPGQPGGTQGIQDLLKGLDKPTMQKIVQSSKELFPDNPKIKEMESLNQQIFDLQKQRPDLESEGIAALRQHEAQRKSLLGQQREGDFWGKLSAYGKDLYERGSNDRLNRVISGIDARDRADIDASLIAKQMELKLMDLAHQRQVGNLEQQQKLKKEIIDLDQKRQDNIIQASNIGEHLAATIYGQEAGARTTAATMAQKEREMALMRKSHEMGAAQTMLARLNEDIDLKGNNIKKDYLKQNEDRLKMIIDIPGENEKIKAEKTAARNAIYAEAEAVKENAVADLKRQRDLVMQKITGVDMNDMSKWGKLK